MCKLCKFVSNSKNQAVYWTCISNEYFKKLIRESKPCKRFRDVQTHVFCFDNSHEDGPKNVNECTSRKLHRSSTFCLMHPSKTELLPTPLDLSSIAHEYSPNNITKKRFSVNQAFRHELHSKERRLFAREGFLSLNIDFTAEEEEELTMCMQEIVARERRRKIVYDGGHYGYPISIEQILQYPEVSRILHSRVVPFYRVPSNQGKSTQLFRDNKIILSFRIILERDACIGYDKTDVPEGRRHRVPDKRERQARLLLQIIEACKHAARALRRALIHSHDSAAQHQQERGGAWDA